MRNPEYSIYGAAKVDNEGNLDAGEDRFNQVRSMSTFMLTGAVGQPHFLSGLTSDLASTSAQGPAPTWPQPFR